MKYIAFLSGELSISATYFSPFANVMKSEICDTQSIFGTDSSQKWRPWTYEERVKVAAVVPKKKQELSFSSTRSKSHRK